MTARADTAVRATGGRRGKSQPASGRPSKIKSEWQRARAQRRAAGTCRRESLSCQSDPETVDTVGGFHRLAFNHQY